MDFVSHLQAWAKQDMTQGKVMVGFGLLLIAILITILRSNNELFRGLIIPLALAVFILVGYGSYVILSRQSHVIQMTSTYHGSASDAIQREIVKQQKDYNSCKTLTRIYPILMILAILTLLFIASPYYKGMALGFVFLFIIGYLIDSNFMAHSKPFITYLKGL